MLITCGLRRAAWAKICLKNWEGLENIFSRPSQHAPDCVSTAFTFHMGCNAWEQRAAASHDDAFFGAPRREAICPSLKTAQSLLFVLY